MEIYPFVDPLTKKALTRKEKSEGKFLEGHVLFPIHEHYVDLVLPRNLSGELLSTQQHCDERASVYDDFLPLTFATHGIDELSERMSFISELSLTGSETVLEVGCGTGRDSSLIADMLVDDGSLHVLDLSPQMLEKTYQKLSEKKVKFTICAANAAHLPYPDNYFDAIYSFGGLGEFPDPIKFFQELERVSKVGARVVLGDESLPPWLRGSYFGNVLCETNKQFLAEIPWAAIPVCVRGFSLRYVINNCFYLISFFMGAGEPEADFDIPIPGIRGGTYRTRFEGKLEGVSADTKELVLRACQAKGVSIYELTNQVLREGVGKILSVSERPD